MKTTEALNVALGAREYPIHIASGLIDKAGEMIAPLLARPFTVIVTDETVASRHLGRLEAALTSAGIASVAVVVPAGEMTKSFTHLASVCDKLLAGGVERGDTIVAFGGGVVGDLAGFAAAVVLRGVAFVQIPTTLLAQVDSAVGGKTGINSTVGKNLIGAFHQPRAVIADTALLDTLPQRERAAGYAEVVKYGLIGDAAFFGWLEDNGRKLLDGDGDARAFAIRRGCEIKARVVAADEHEQGQRALLNLGHTFGHALEAAAGYDGALLHGEAVSVGMVLALRYSHSLGLCPCTTPERASRVLAAAGLPVSLADITTRPRDARAMVTLMRKDKKSRNGKMVLVLVRDIGEAFIEPCVDEAGLLDFLEELW